jgi:hypothetical protein
MLEFSANLLSSALGSKGDQPHVSNIRGAFFLSDILVVIFHHWG